MAEPGSIRAFAAIPVAPDLKAEILRLQERLQRLFRKNPVRWVRGEQLHLTLKFYGNVDSTQVASLTAALRMACEGVRPFELSITGSGCFPSFQRPNVVWLGLTGDLPVLEQLQIRIEQQTKDFGRQSDNRSFHPHLTLGRIKAGPSAAREVGRVIQEAGIGEIGRWKVGEFELIQSTLSPRGISYQEVECFVLCGAVQNLLTRNGSP
ncbi:MAG: RNA 2',3'-cyclic phosphodiesterase [Verrucomicrobia bacterium]|nr:RNA 2',3'-cyclic phosphodiesterase [Verrucomicrobiota bacterium]